MTFKKLYEKALITFKEEDSEYREKNIAFFKALACAKKGAKIYYYRDEGDDYFDLVELGDKPLLGAIPAPIIMGVAQLSAPEQGSLFEVLRDFFGPHFEVVQLDRSEWSGPPNGSVYEDIDLDTASEEEIREAIGAMYALPEYLVEISNDPVLVEERWGYLKGCDHYPDPKTDIVSVEGRYKKEAVEGTEYEPSRPLMYRSLNKYGGDYLIHGGAVVFVTVLEMNGAIDKRSHLGRMVVRPWALRDFFNAHHSKSAACAWLKKYHKVCSSPDDFEVDGLRYSKRSYCVGKGISPMVLNLMYHKALWAEGLPNFSPHFSEGEE